MKEYLKKYKFIILFIIITVIFFSSHLVITWDSTHYLTYVDILEGNSTFSNWDIVRGPVFPILLFLSDSIFGKSDIGILIMMYLFFLLFFYTTYSLLKNIFTKNKHKDLISLIITCVVCLNPMVLGYFHAMLCEFVAITLSMLSINIGLKYYKEENKKIRILYSLYYVLGVTFAYFLKQPYVLICLLPLLISSVLAIINNHKLKNVLYYVGTVLLSVIVLFASIKVWNHILVSKGLDLNTNRNAVNILGEQLYHSIDGYEYKIVNNKDDIYYNEHLSDKEKTVAYNWLNEYGKVYVLSVKDNDRVLEDDIVFIGDNNNPSTIKMGVEILKTFVKHPIIVISSHLKSYCGLSSICVIDIDSGLQFPITDEVDFVNAHENDSIGYRSFREIENNFYFPSERMELAQYYIEPVSQSFISKIYENLFEFTSRLFKFVIISAPLFLILLIIFRIVIRKHLVNYTIYISALFLLLFGVFGGFINAWVSSVIDRYVMFCFVPNLIGIILTVYFIVINISRRNKKDSSKGSVKRGKNKR